MDLEVGGSIPPTNYCHISSVGRALVVVMMPEVLGSSPRCDTNFGGPSGERRGNRFPWVDFRVV